MTKQKARMVRWSLLIYTLVSLVITLVYVIFHLKHYQINWVRYEENGTYYLWAQKIMRQGTLRLIGSEFALHSIGLKILFGLGILLALAVFLLAWRSFYGRTFLPFLALLGFLLPLLLHGTNTLIVLLLSFLLILLGAILSAVALKSLE